MKKTMELVVRWEDSQRVRWCFGQNAMQPSWKHFVPQLGKTRVGICCDPETSSRWKAPGRKVGLVFDLTRLRPGTRWFAFDGNAVHSLSDELLWEPDAKRRQEKIDWWMSDPARLLGSLDEVFIAGRIPVMSECLVAVWLAVGNGERLGPKTLSDIRRYCEEHAVPAFQCVSATGMVAGFAEMREHLSLEQTFEDLGGTRPDDSILAWPSRGTLDRQRALALAA